MTKKKKLKREREMEFFDQYRAIMYGVMKRMGLTYSNPYYEEYEQIGRIHLVKAYEIFPGDAWDENQREDFVKFAYTKIRWGILDAMRQHRRRQDMEEGFDEELKNTLSCTASAFTDAIIEKDWLEGILVVLDEPEKRLVIDLCVHQLSMTDIAKKEKVSRNTIYKRRKKVQDRLLETKYKNKGVRYEIDYH